MPPKLPNLKFRPRHVVSQKEVKDEAEFAAGVDDLSFLQLERLRRQREEAQLQQRVHKSGDATTARPPPRGAPSARTGPGDRPPPGRAARTHSAPSAVCRTAAFLAPEAERFAANTMTRVLEAGASGAGATVYHPTTLDCTLPACIKMREPEGRVEGDDRRPEITTQNDGIAFLKEFEEELRRSREANMRFEREVLRHSANKIEVEGSVGRHDEGELVWFQFPRFHANPPFLLTQLPSGKVGEIKVYKSGRMVMEICGVYYDVAVEGYTAGGDSSCNVATVVAPSQQSEEKACCYQLGLLSKKMVCTPIICVNEGMQTAGA